MTDPVGADGVQDVDGALRREADQLIRRFSDVDSAEILRRMRETYARLDRQATVKSHLVTITTGVVGNSLRADQAAPPTP